MGREFLWDITRPLKPRNVSLEPIERIDPPPSLYPEPAITPSNTIGPTLDPITELPPSQPTGPLPPIYDQGPFNPELPPYIDPETPPWLLVGPELTVILGDVGIHGSIIYRGARKWRTLSPGTKGQVLKTQGANADPAWEDK